MGTAGWPRWTTGAVAIGVRLLAVWALAGCAAAPRAWPPADGAEGLVLVAIPDAPEIWPAAGATPRAAYASNGYGGSRVARFTADRLAARYGLTERAAWTITALGWRCMLYQPAAGADRDALLAALAAESPVTLAQPLQTFRTLADPRPPPPPPRASPAPPSPPIYDDPYLSLQRGWAEIGAARAHGWSRGEGVAVAVVDSGVAQAHPDLAGRIATSRDFAAGQPPAQAGERHGTEVAGIIAATAGNGVGIAGVAPAARVLAYRACWPDPAGPGDRCDSFTLARALVQAIADGADVINLSLGGPADPLLARLVAEAQARGALVVGALPASGRREGFPTGLPGVLAAARDDAPAPAGSLRAPGRDVLTLEPGGHYGFASGSSFAAAHVSGTLALMRALSPQRPAAALWTDLGADGHEALALDACRALRRERADADCRR